MSSDETKWSQHIDPTLWEDDERFRSLIADISGLLSGQGVDPFWRETWIEESFSLFVWANRYYELNRDDNDEILPQDVLDNEIRGMSIERRIKEFDNLAHCVREAVAYI